MRSLIFIAILFGLSACTMNKSVVVIPAGQTIELDYPDYEVYRATLKNKGGKGLEVAVLSKDENKQIRGFGLGTLGKVDVMVEAANKLVLRNKNKSDASVAVAIEKEQPSVFDKKGEYVSFILRNTTAKSIPLIIPSVMNPNLSPFSKSGVDLKLGQEILFKAKGKKYVLLTVDKSIAEGDEINVAQLLKDRKEALGLK